MGIASLVHPRVWFAILNAICNGWTINFRFQRRRPCLFACGFGEDSLHHYAHCTVIADYAQRRLNLERPAAGNRLDCFLALSPCFCVSVASEVARRALCLFAVHSATNAARHGSIAGTAEALEQFAKEACASHAPLRRIVASEWTS